MIRLPPLLTLLPLNRYTLEGAQAIKVDCLVEAGYGIVDSTSQVLLDTNAASQMTLAAAADAGVLQCPATHWSAGGKVDSVCVPCPGGHMALDGGATQSADCNCKWGSSLLMNG
jgi:hypothetical protein